MERECFEGEVQPYWKTDYKLMSAKNTINHGIFRRTPLVYYHHARLCLEFEKN